MGIVLSARFSVNEHILAMSVVCHLLVVEPLSAGDYTFFLFFSVYLFVIVRVVSLC